MLVMRIFGTCFWYIKILVSILWRDFFLWVKFLGCRFLGFEGYRLNIRDPSTVNQNQFQAKFNAANRSRPVPTARTLWTASNCGCIQISSFSLPVWTPWIDHHWLTKTESKIFVRKNEFLVSRNYHFTPTKSRQIFRPNKKIEKIFEKFRFWIEYKIFSFDFRRKF